MLLEQDKKTVGMHGSLDRVPFCQLEPLPSAFFQGPDGAAVHGGQQRRQVDQPDGRPLGRLPQGARRAVEVEGRKEGRGGPKPRQRRTEPNVKFKTSWD